MAAGVLQGPDNEEYGPCAEPCGHKDCAETREMAASRCTVCGRKIGYGIRFYDETPGEGPADQPFRLVHAACREGMTAHERGDHSACSRNCPAVL